MMKTIFKYPFLLFPLLCLTLLVSGLTNSHASVEKGSIDISGYIITQSGGNISFTIPNGTILQDNGILIIARNTTKTGFENYWGINLDSNVVYINSGNRFPLFKGNDSFTLSNTSGNILDGPTIRISSSIHSNQSLQRINLSGSADEESCWIRISLSGTTDREPTPGTQSATTSGSGLRLSEITDAPGNIGQNADYIEIYYDVKSPASVKRTYWIFYE